MTNIIVCLFTVSIFCCTDLSWARQVPKECTKGPEFWCTGLKQAADCGAVQHCIGTIWEKQTVEIRDNEISHKFIRLFKQLKDVKDLINTDYLANRVRSACRDAPQLVSKICLENTAHLDEYLYHLVTSDAKAETMCRVVGVCNNVIIDNFLALDKKKATEDKPKPVLLGSEQCTWGPSYWCSNFSTGRECRKTHHCIQKVWSKMEVPEDKDDICKICTDMVKQARDQLQSNETQEELKEVFEGSCKLIPVKIVAKECMKLADDFVPELVETLASQMNPQQVCSVAGLCNSGKIDTMLQEYSRRAVLREDCIDCRATATALRNKFDGTTYDDFLVGLLQICGKMDSLSDSCSMLVFKYYENILEAIRKDLTPNGLCHMSGQCAFQYHSHDKDYIFADKKFEKDDVPCEFCEKLVVHLRDVLVANATELQFEKVLKGLCKQTGQFKSECLHLVEEYYSTIYSFLVNDLKPARICSMMGICGKPLDVPVAPLLPKELSVKVITPKSKLIGAEEAKIARIPITKQANVRIMGDMTPISPLPIERMFVSLPRTPVEAQAACSFCQYFLHYLQVELSDTNNEAKIQEAVDKACDRLPQTVSDECRQFVSQYGPAVVALLVHEIDPSSVCPALRLCPQTQQVSHVDINSEKSNCPLCLFAVEQLETMLKNNRSEETIRKALSDLCNHLSQKLRTECVDFVDQYSNQLVEMLVANLDAQEICVFLKLCTDDSHRSDPFKLAHKDIDKYHEKPNLRGDRNNFRKGSLLPKTWLQTGDIETNEIPDNTVNGRPVKETQKPTCVICEFVMTQIEDEIKDKHNEDEIKKLVHNVCMRMPKSVRNQCDQFVEKYADLIISLLTKEMDPTEVCQELRLCDPTNGVDALKTEILDCAICETVVLAVKKVITNDRVDRDIVHIVEKSCALLPAKYSARCHTMLEIYGASVIHLIEQYGSKGVCKKIGLCTAANAQLHMSGGN